MQLLARDDPDVSAAFNAYLTISNTDMQIYAYDPKGNLDPKGMNLAQQVILSITKENDYTQGFQIKPSLKTICENMRYLMLLRGGVLVELVFDKNLSPSEIRETDLASMYWWERTPGQYKPEQRVSGSILELDYPSIFASFHHRDPTAIYTDSSFVSAINTISARQQVVNDLYRIMQVTGYPRLDIAVLEELIIKNAPADIKKNATAQRAWVNARLADVNSAVSNIRPDQAFVHFDSVKASTMNDRTPGMALNITPVIDMLNAQNQAALKVMATIIGRGSAGVNTASVEARIFTMNCDELNMPVAECWSNILTLAVRLQGYQGYIECCFKPAELRPETELEPHLVIKAARLKQDLSLGIISDEEYCLKMYGRLPNPGAPTLSGTGFMNQQTSQGLEDPPVATGGGPASPGATTTTSPNNGPLNRSLATPGAKAAKSNIIKKAA